MFQRTKAIIRLSSYSVLVTALFVSRPCWAEQAFQIQLAEATSEQYEDASDAVHRVITDDFVLTGYRADSLRGASCGCDDASCGYDSGCCGSCCSLATVRIGAVFMQRSTPDNIPLVTANGGAGATILNANDFSFDFEPGVDATFIYHDCSETWGIEARYLWISEWSSTRNFTGLNLAGINTNPFTALGAATLDATYQSELQGFEINLRRRCCSGCVTLLAGFRYVDLDERLDLVFDGVILNHWMTMNDMYGFQLGGEAILYEHCCGLRIEGVGKAGIYGNNAKVGTRLDVVEVLVSQNGGMDHVAFLGELGLSVSYPITCCWRVRAGYHVMWIDGVLLAANQVPITDPNNMMATNMFDYSDVFYHGASVMLEATW